LVVVMIVLPWVALPVPVLLLVFYLLRRWYIGASRQIKRIESVTRSPVYAHLSETLNGLPVLRAMRVQSQFVDKFMDLQDANTRAMFSQYACARWLGIRLDFVSAVFLLLAGIVSLVLVSTGTLSAAMAGYALSYTLLMNGLVQWVVRQSVEVEMAFVSVERMIEYCDLEGESAADGKKYNDKVPEQWPSKGELQLNHVSLTYPSSTKPALDEWTIAFTPGQRVGIVGRSGGGKSTFFAALFRMYNFTGSMRLDGVETANLGVETLRSRLAALPQDPFLFNGTIRFNLDPFGQVADHELWVALGRVELKDYVDQLPGKLDAMVENGGSNLSVGQRQLLCLARALLKKAKVLVMDECSANIDMKVRTCMRGVMLLMHPLVAAADCAHGCGCN
jgi:ATP-binding cassette subfamily C (CFTR/MRP) protein 4